MFTLVKSKLARLWSKTIFQKKTQNKTSIVQLNWKLTNKQVNFYLMQLWSQLTNLTNIKVFRNKEFKQLKFHFQCMDIYLYFYLSIIYHNCHFLIFSKIIIILLLKNICIYHFEFLIKFY